MPPVPSSSESDAALLTQYQQGNARAFHHIVERYATPLYNLAYRWVRDRMEAENIAQETFLRVIIAIERIRLDEPFKPYLFRIALNLCRDLARKKRPTVFSDWQIPGDESTEDASDTIINDAPAPWERLAEAELQTQLRGAIARLPAHYQTVIVLRYVEEFSYAEIAQAINLPLNTVRTHLRRAKQQLRVALASDAPSIKEELE